MFLFFFHEIVRCVYLLEPYRGDFNVYTQHTVIV